MSLIVLASLTCILMIYIYYLDELNTSADRSIYDALAILYSLFSDLGIIVAYSVIYYKMRKHLATIILTQ